MNIINKFWHSLQEAWIWRWAYNNFPPLFYRFIWKIFNFFYFVPSWNRNLVLKNKKIKNTSVWKRAFVLATWPSINWENLKLLKNEDCFSVSNFFLHDDINIINPMYHFFFPFHEPLILENYIDWLKLADKTLPKETKIFLYHTTKKHVDEYNLFPNREIFYMYTMPFWSKYNYDITKCIYTPSTWPQMIIPVLIYMWYTEIYLLWCDNNTLKTYREDRKDFYNRDKDVRKNAADKGSWSNIIETLERQLSVFKCWDILGKMAIKNWVKIINLSQDSRIDTFKKSSLVKVLW